MPPLPKSSVDLFSSHNHWELSNPIHVIHERPPEILPLTVELELQQRIFSINVVWNYSCRCRLTTGPTWSAFLSWRWHCRYRRSLEKAGLGVLLFDRIWVISPFKEMGFRMKCRMAKCYLSDHVPQKKPCPMSRTFRM